ncbi:MAG: hypothetical protein Gaeavirus37_1, partial [Gaeavirus sp.]
MNNNNNNNHQVVPRASSIGLDERSKRLDIDGNPFKIKLKPHQEALLYKVLDIDQRASFSNTSFAVMSDKPGSGKTYVILSMIYYSIKFFNSSGANIIVVPHNIYTQWEKSIKNFLGEALTYKLLLDYSDISALYSNSSVLYNNDIILTTSAYYDVFASTVKSMNLKVRRVFFDEADSIKNLLAHAMPSGITWFVSASIHSVFDNISQKAQIGSYQLYLPNLLVNECFCKPEFIDANFIVPNPEEESFECRDFYIDKILSNVLQRDQLEFINAHDFSNIRPECSNMIIKNTKDVTIGIYECAVKKSNDLAIDIKELERKIRYTTDYSDKNNFEAAKAKKDIQKGVYDIRISTLKMFATRYELCIKCFGKIKCINKDTYKIEYYQTECNEWICKTCYNKEIEPEIQNESTDINKIKIKCLTCKFHLVESLKIHMDDISGVADERKEKLDNTNKLVMLPKIIDVCKKKIIIYSQFRGLLNFMKSYIIGCDYKFIELDGG